MYQWLFHTSVGITGRKTRKYFLLTRQIPRMSQVVLLCCRNSQCGSVLPGKGRMGRCTTARAYSIRRLQVQNAFKSINQKLPHLVQFLQCMFSTVGLLISIPSPGIISSCCICYSINTQTTVNIFSLKP